MASDVNSTSTPTAQRPWRRVLLISCLAATALLWIASYFNFVYTSGDALCYVYLESGAWVMHFYDGPGDDGPPVWDCLGYEGLETLILPRLTLYSDKIGVVVPLWLLAVLCILGLIRKPRARAD